MKNLLSLMLSIFVTWEFELGNCLFTYRDILEVKDVITGAWREIPGPYQVMNDNYLVEVDGTRPQQFYRISRSYGSPNVL